MAGSPDMVWVSSSWSLVCSDMGIPNDKKKLCQWCQSFPTFKCGHYLNTGAADFFPQKPKLGKNSLSDSQVKETSYSTFTQSDILQMEVLE